MPPLPSERFRMTDLQGHPPTCGSVVADAPVDRVKALRDLVSTLRTADQVLAQAAAIPPDDLERIAPDLVHLWMGDAQAADPDEWARRVAADARLAAGR